MRDYVISDKTTVIPAGLLGEHLATRVVFPWAACWPDAEGATFQVQLLRPGDTEPYAAARVTSDAENVYWVLTDTDTARQGFVQVQLCAYRDAAILKRLVLRAFVGASLAGPDEEADPYTVSIFTALIEEAARQEDAHVQAVQSASAQAQAQLTSMMVTFTAQVLDAQTDIQNAREAAVAAVGSAKTEALAAIADALEAIDAATVPETLSYLNIE